MLNGTSSSRSMDIQNHEKPLSVICTYKSANQTQGPSEVGGQYGDHRQQALLLIQIHFIVCTKGLGVTKVQHKPLLLGMHWPRVILIRNHCTHIQTRHHVRTSTLT